MNLCPSWSLTAVPAELILLREAISQANKHGCTNLIQQVDNLIYDGFSFEIKSKKICYRKSKLTPKKSGQFVTFWKRDENRITIPFSANDGIDFLIIAVVEDENFGYFLFPKDILIAKGIFSSSNKTGKRAMRIYPPWYCDLNKQATATQIWQLPYFTLYNPSHKEHLYTSSLLQLDNYS